MPAGSAAGRAATPPSGPGGGGSGGPLGRGEGGPKGDRWAGRGEDVGLCLFYVSAIPIQGVVTPIGAVLTAETGDTTRSPGHGSFFNVSVTVLRGVS